MSAQEHPLKRLWVLMATVFVDMLGFFIVLPLLPYYAERLGADPVQVGALVSTFALAQLATSSIWGRLSDRYGRKPMIICGLLISAVAYTVFESATTVWLLFLSRFVQGAGSGTIGVVQAYVSDSVGRGERAKVLGWVTTATSAGVMLGPVVGSAAAGLGWVGPGHLAAGLCLLNATFAGFWLRESAAASGEGSAKRQKVPGETRKMIAATLLHPRGPIASGIWVYTLGMMAFMAMNGIFALYLERVFAIDETEIGWFFAYVGGISLVMRAFFIGPAVSRWGEYSVMRAGAVAVTVGMAAVPFARDLFELALAVLFIPVGTAFLFPTTTSLVSARAPEGQTGLVLGVQQTYGGVARMVGPIWAGFAFQHASIRTPFWLAAGVMVLARLFAGRIREIEGTGEEPPAVDPR